MQCVLTASPKCVGRAGKGLQPAVQLASSDWGTADALRQRALAANSSGVAQLLRAIRQAMLLHGNRRDDVLDTVRQATGSQGTPFALVICSTLKSRPRADARRGVAQELAWRWIG